MSNIKAFNSYVEFLNREDKTINGFYAGYVKPILVDCEGCWMCYACIRCKDCKDCLECNDLENRSGCRLLFK